jgi:hypothetical protein
MAFMPPLLTPEKLPDFLYQHLQNLELYSPFVELSLSTQNFKEALIVVIKWGGIAEAAISALLGRIDSIIKYSPFLITKVVPKGETV